MTRKDSKKINKCEYDNLLAEANELTKFNMISKIEEMLKSVKLSKKQSELINKIESNEIVSVLGPAGTAKTYCSIYAALKEITVNKNTRIFLTKPIVEAGEHLGFLPGEINDKIDPYLKSYQDLFVELIGKEATKKLFDDKKVEFCPVAYMRGRNLQNRFIIIDEAQNFTMSQLMTLVTRKHKNSKVIFLGDIMQDDRPKAFGENPYLTFINHILKPIKSKVGTFEFSKDDIVRDKLIIDIINNYEIYLKTIKNS